MKLNSMQMFDSKDNFVKNYCI